MGDYGERGELYRFVMRKVYTPREDNYLEQDECLQQRQKQTSKDRFSKKRENYTCDPNLGGRGSFYSSRV